MKTFLKNLGIRPSEIKRVDFNPNLEVFAEHGDAYDFICHSRLFFEVAGQVVEAALTARSVYSAEPVHESPHLLGEMVPEGAKSGVLVTSFLNGVEALYFKVPNDFDRDKFVSKLYDEVLS